MEIDGVFRFLKISENGMHTYEKRLFTLFSGFTFHVRHGWQLLEDGQQLAPAGWAKCPLVAIDLDL